MGRPDAMEPFSLEEMAAKYRHGGLVGRARHARDRLRRGSLRRRQHRDQQRALPPAPGRPRDEWARALQHRRVHARRARPLRRRRSRPSSSVAKLPGAPPLSSAVLERGATKLGWRVGRVHAGVPLRRRGPGGRSRRWRARSCPRAVEAGARILADCRVGRAAPQRRPHRRRASAASATPTARRAASRSAPSTSSCAAARSRRPALLQRSGIRARIGSGLKLHPTIKIAARFPQPHRPRRRADAPRHRVRAATSRSAARSAAAATSRSRSPKPGVPAE